MVVFLISSDYFSRILPDCIAAVTACGGDIDRAISWLCERPPETTTVTQKKSDSNSKTGVEADVQKMMEAAAKAKKDADHKEGKKFL